MLIIVALALGAGPPVSVSLMNAPRSVLIGHAFRARSGRADEAAAYRAMVTIREGVGEWHPRHAEALSLFAIVLEHRGEFRRALPLRERAAIIRSRTDGRRSLAYALAVGQIGSVLWDLGRLEEAERRLRESLALTEVATGNRSRETGRCLNNLALVVKERGRPGEAAVMLERALELGGGIHTTHNLALAYHAMGDYVRALRRYRQAEYIYGLMRSLPDGDVPWARCLTSLGSLHHEMGDLDEADRLFKRASPIFTGRLARHPARGTLLNNRAMLAKSRGNLREAVTLLNQGLALEVAMRGENSPEVAVKRHNLATVLIDLGELDRAEQMLEHAQASRRKAGAARHTYYGNGLVELARVAEQRSQFARALALNEEASAVYLEASGRETSRLSGSRYAEARLYFRRGDLRQAERRIGQALEVARLDLERCAGALSERQQLERTVNLRHNLDLCLSLPKADAYPHVLVWKGVVSDRQARLRALAQRSADPAIQKLGRELDETARRLAHLSLLAPTGAAAETYRKELLATQARLEAKEKELSRAEPAFATARVTPAELAARLPAETALVDILVYQRKSPPRKGGVWGTRTEVAAFIVRPGKPVCRVELGEASEMEAAVTNWRRSVQLGGGTGEVARALARRLLLPLRPYLKGTKRLLVSPDGATARIPWAALPGEKPGTFLLEEMAVAVVPVPRQALPRKEKETPSLLVLGDVDFDARAGRSVASSRTAFRGGGQSWSALPATRAEADSVAAGFGKAFPKARVASLKRQEGTEEAVRKLVPGRTHVHFATHGFFAPQKKRAALPPGLLSGLVLAGANRKLDTSLDDGILTAREVAELDLSKCELATLSACETGLGPTAGGEGLLGLQRAFQVAGARSAVTSLWKVPDAATAVLMERFYANLWKKKMGKAEALREAQLFVLREGARQPKKFRTLTLASGTTTLKPLADGRMPPLMWAAWILSGDWR